MLQMVAQKDKTHSFKSQLVDEKWMKSVNGAFRSA